MASVVDLWPRSRPRCILFIVLGLILLVLAAGTMAVAAEPADHPTNNQSTAEEPVDETTIEPVNETAIEEVVDEAMADRIGSEVPGATVVVVAEDEPVLMKGYGEANTETGQPVDPNRTAFNVGSVGKLVTWTAVMNGVENGELDLDRDVNTYLADSDVSVPETYAEPVTLRHLGTHTAGFDQRHESLMATDSTDVDDLEQELATSQPPRVTPPGSEVAYSNYGTGLAGHIAAQSADQPFDRHVESTVFDPLGMDRSTFAQPVPEPIAERHAAAHSPTEDGFAVSDRGYVRWAPAGGMSTTGGDMASFMRLHLNEGSVDGTQLLAPETVEEMHATHHERHGAINGLRYGFYEYGAPDDELIAHSGGKLHYSSKLVLAPEADVGVFVAYNTRNDQSPPNEVADEILAEYDLLTESSTDHQPPEPTAEKVQRAEQVAGEYEATVAPETGPAQLLGLAARQSVETTDDGRLLTDRLGDGQETWVETDPYVYESLNSSDILVAEVENGTVTALHRNSEPVVAYNPVHPTERTAVVGGSLGLALGGFVLSIVGWGGLAIRRRLSAWRARINGSTEPTADTESQTEGRCESTAGRRWSVDRLIRVAGMGMILTSVAFVALLVAAVAQDGELVFVTKPVAFVVATALPWPIAVLTAITAVGTIQAWREGYWSQRLRVYWTVMALFGLVFVWQLRALGFM